MRNFQWIFCQFCFKNFNKIGIFQCCQIFFSKFRQIFRHIAPPRNWWFLATFTPQKSYFGHTLAIFSAKIFPHEQDFFVKFSQFWQNIATFGILRHQFHKFRHLLVAGATLVWKSATFWWRGATNFHRPPGAQKEPLGGKRATSGNTAEDSK